MTQRNTMLTQKEFLIRAIKIHKEIYDYTNSVYTGMHHLMNIRCKKHNFIFTQRPHDHLDGQGCPKCGKDSSAASRTLPLEFFIEEAIKIHKNKYLYHNFKYKNSKIKGDIWCAIHLIFFQQAPGPHLNGQGCPECKRDIMTINNPATNPIVGAKIAQAWRKKTPEDLKKIKEAKELTSIKNYGYTNPMLNNEIKARGHASKKKNKSYGKSKIEDLFFEHFIKIYPDLIRQELINNWAIDFYFPSKNIYVQLDGVYYHGLNRDLEIIKLFKTSTDKKIYRTYLKDREQESWFLKNNLILIRITDEEAYDYFDKEIISENIKKIL